MKVIDFYRYSKKLGFSSSLKLFMQEFRKKERIYFTLPSRLKLVIRPKSSDLKVFIAIFFKEVYRIRKFDKILPSFSPSTIVDAGANIGLSTAYYANRYPKAQIVALEPEQNNYKLLKLNVLNFSNVRTEQLALWKNNYDTLIIKNPEADNYAFKFSTSQNVKESHQHYKTTSINEIMKSNNWGTIDLLKMDIEGAEYEVFFEDTNWLSNVMVLIIELHDGLRKGASKIFWKAIVKHDFLQLNHDENIILINEKLLVNWRKNENN